jgi:hypothetical protein
MEEKVGENIVTRFFENDAIKLTFEITNERMTNIAIEIKEEELYPPIEIGDKRRIFQWLNNFATQISQYLGSAPTELIRKKEDDDLMPKVPVVCPRCRGKELEMRGSCCGGKGNNLVCSSCGLKLRVKTGQ